MMSEEYYDGSDDADYDTQQHANDDHDTIGCAMSSHAALELGQGRHGAHPFVHGHTLLWYQHVIYTREAVKSRLLGLPDVKEQTQRLLRNQDDLAASLEPFLGSRTAAEYKRLLTEHITIAVELVDAASGETSDRVEPIRARWEQNGEQIRDLLHRAQRQRVRFLQQKKGRYSRKNAWCPIKLLKHWKTHLDQTQAEAIALIGKNWEEANAQFDAALAHMGEYGTRLAKGFLYLWPEEATGNDDRMSVGNIFGGGAGRAAFYDRNPTDYPPERDDRGQIRYVPHNEDDTERMMMYPADRVGLVHVINREPVAVVLHVKGSRCGRRADDDCNRAENILERLGAEMRDVVFIYNDVERQVAMPAIEEFPTVDVYRDGEVVGTLDGLQTEGTYRDFIRFAVEDRGDQEQGCLDDGDGTGAGPGPDVTPMAVEESMSMEEDEEEEEDEFGDSQVHYYSIGAADGTAVDIRMRNGIYEPDTLEQMASLRSYFKTLLVIYGFKRCKYTRKGLEKMRKVALRYEIGYPEVAFVFFDVNKLTVDPRDRTKTRDRHGKVTSAFIRVPYYRLIADTSNDEYVPKSKDLTSLIDKLDEQFDRSITQGGRMRDRNFFNRLRRRRR